MVSEIGADSDKQQYSIDLAGDEVFFESAANFFARAQN
jgi:hypothetical protein